MRQLSKHRRVVTALAPITPSTSTPDYINAAKFDHLTVVISVDNGATVTGSDITLVQATAADGTGAKALSFTKAYRSIDVAAANGDILSEFTVSSDTFTTDETDNKNLLYVIEVPVENMDTNNGFDFVRVGTGDGANMVLCALYIVDPAYVGGDDEQSMIA